MARHGSRLMDFFEDIDRDNSGHITRDEFVDGVQVCQRLVVRDGPQFTYVLTIVISWLIFIAASVWSLD